MKMIRKPKQRLLIRRKIYWAAMYKWDCAMYRRLNNKSPNG